MWNTPRSHPSPCVQALDALAEAIGNIERHAQAATDMFEVHGRVMKQQRFNDEQRHLEKRAFETLLRGPELPPAGDAWTKKAVSPLRSARANLKRPDAFAPL